MYLDGTAVACNWHTINHDSGAVGVRHVSLIKFIVEVGVFRHLTLVGQIDFEAGWFAERHTADALLVYLDLRILNFLCAFINDRARVIEQRRALILPRTAGGTTTSAIDETTGCGVVVEVEFSLQVLIVVIHLLVEFVAEEHIEYVVARQSVSGGLHPIHVKVQMALSVHADFETLRASI